MSCAKSLYRLGAFCIAVGLLTGGAAALVAAPSPTSGQSASDKLIVHEWGTFTSLQDENGQALGGINVDDEPVPPFVHQWMSSYVVGPANGRSASLFAKGLEAKHPYVTLRLETPVLYFHPPKSQTTPINLEVNVEFKGGWLSQYYPMAQSDLPSKITTAEFARLPLDRRTSSKLTWANLCVGTDAGGPETDQTVWLAPRNVAAANVTTPEGESEKYLFYRGVGNIDSPLSVTSDVQRGTLSLHSRFQNVLAAGQSAIIRQLWLVKIKPDGSAAWRTADSIGVTGDPNRVAATIKADFAKSDFSRDNLESLKQSMHKALMADGLFDDEATAMLATWQQSYFASGGYRLFYVVPRSWTEHYLPLSISQPAQITRVMIGRTELVSPEQQQLLKRLAVGTVSNPEWMLKITDSPNARKFWSGRSDFGDLGVAIPQDYQLYLDLGRFRNALILHEQAKLKSPSLAKFIETYDLKPFQVTQPVAATTASAR